MTNPLKGLDDELIEHLAAIRLAVFDVDGVLTDGRVAYVGGEELQTFDVKDGQGLAWLSQAGIELAWITGRGCRATEVRAAEFGVHLHMRSGPKQERLAAVQEELGIDPERTLAMGDDLADLALASRAQVFCCPGDARPEVRAAAHLVCTQGGGRGAVREVCEALLAAKGNWPPGAGGSCG
jgi:3-deoxy-D-manno-octulosonate 8-phosphate phosphatase (KDO 8-P phosphatase)